MMHHPMKTLWRWQVSSIKGVSDGFLLARDLRDAVSRALTNQATATELVGQMHGIPVDVLNEAPGNADLSYHARGDNYSASVNRVIFNLASRDKGYADFDIHGVPNVHRACPGFNMKQGEFFNVYCAGGRKLSAEWQGTIEESLELFATTERYQALAGTTPL